MRLQSLLWAKDTDVNNKKKIDALLAGAPFELIPDPNPLDEMNMHQTDEFIKNVSKTYQELQAIASDEKESDKSRIECYELCNALLCGLARYGANPLTARYKLV